MPNQVREELNRSIQDGKEGKELVEWLNSLPEAQEVLRREFKGTAINEVNLSHWKTGGYQDWEEKEETVEAVGRLGADFEEINASAKGKLSEQLGYCMMARLAVGLHRLGRFAEDPDKELERERELCRNLVALRRGEQNSEWLKIDWEKLEWKKQKHKEKMEAEKAAAEW